MKLNDLIGRFRGKARQASVSITGINLKLGADVHAIGGMEVKKEIFDLEVPFHNRIGSGLLPSHLKGPEMKINQVIVERPFELLGSSPSTPLSVPYLGDIVFKLRIRAPQGSYSGPLTITFATDSKDNVNIDVAKLTLVHGKERRDVEETASNMILKKSQIIRRDVQAYKILGYGQEVRKIGVSRPFEIVSTDPALPFSVDRKDSYVVKVYIKCPEFNYAGPMEISFE